MAQIAELRSGKEVGEEKTALSFLMKGELSVCREATKSITQGAALSLSCLMCLQVTLINKVSVLTLCAQSPIFLRGSFQRLLLELEEQGDWKHKNEVKFKATQHKATQHKIIYSQSNSENCYHKMRAH